MRIILRRLLTVVPAAVLAASTLAAPSTAAPDDRRGQSSSATAQAQDRRAEAPARKAAAQRVAASARDQQRPAPRTAPQARVPVRETGRSQQAAQQPPRREAAVEGRGFTGSFPFEFSDAQFQSVAVRFARPGEQAADVPLSACPARRVTEPPPPPKPPKPPVPPTPRVDVREQPPGSVVPEQPPGAVVRPDVEARAPGEAPQGVLPDTGAADHRALAGAGMLSLGFGLSLLLWSLRRRGA